MVQIVDVPASPDRLLTIQKMVKDGVCSREDYWREINQNLHKISQFSCLLGEKCVGIELMGKDILVKYSLYEGRYIKLVLPLDDLRTASFTILSNGTYEPFLEDLIFGLTKQSSIFIDIGANMGFYSTGAAILNPNIKCYAFEPNPHILKSLISNTILNETNGQVEVKNLALGNTDSELEFFVPALTGSGGGSLQNLHPDEGEADRIYVKVKKLDQLEIACETIDFIKIDVEGAELQVLQGAIEIIRKNRPTLVVELLRKWMKYFNTTPQDVVDFLLTEGYRCFAVTENSLCEITVVDDATIENNFVFHHPSKQDHIDFIAEKIELN